MHMCGGWRWILILFSTTPHFSFRDKVSHGALSSLILENKLSGKPEHRNLFVSALPEL